VHCDEHQPAADGYEKSINSLLKLRYLGQTPISVRGTITRNVYRFPDFQSVQTVDLRDARFLLASRLFGMVR
jgi:hypothetical protein